jgi:hypothetical protein
MKIALRFALVAIPVAAALSQAPSFSFAGVSLSSDFKTVAARYRRSTPQDNYISIVPEDSHDHISAIAISGNGPTRRVRIAFEIRRAKGLDYPACAEVEAKIVRAYGAPQQIRTFDEEASRRADRIWQSKTEQLDLLCFRMPGGRLLAEAVQIVPR